MLEATIKWPISDPIVNRICFNRKIIRNAIVLKTNTHTNQPMSKRVNERKKDHTKIAYILIVWNRQLSILMWWFCIVSTHLINIHCDYGSTNSQKKKKTDQNRFSFACNRNQNETLNGFRKSTQIQSTAHLMNIVSINRFKQQSIKLLAK